MSTKITGVTTALIAIATAPAASSMPAPQVVVVQAHSLWSLPSGAWQRGTLTAPGKARALRCRIVFTCAGVSVGWAASTSAAVAAVRGAEKLVPRPRSVVPFVYPDAAGVVVPLFVVDMIGYRQAPLGLTQLPAGADNDTSGPASE